MSRRIPRSLALAILFAPACSPRDPGDSTLTTFGSGDEVDESTSGVETSGTEDADDASTEEDESEGETSGTKFDLGADGGTDDDPEGGEESCSKVDVVLAVDASTSMDAEIATLPATFMLMKDTLTTQVGDGITDFRIGVINACPNPAFFHDWAAGDTNCGFPQDRNWLASSDPNIDAQFACVVDIPLQEEALDENDGENGGYQSQPDFCSDSEDEDEQPAWTAAEAVQPGVAENADFLRDDAILFVIAITDEDEAFVTVDDPQSIRGALLSAKGGIENNVTFLGIGGDDCESAYDGSDVKDSDNLRDVAESFGERGLYRTMCEGPSADPIADAFEEALTTIVDAACDDYVPQG